MGYFEQNPPVLMAKCNQTANLKENKEMKKKTLKIGLMSAILFDIATAGALTPKDILCVSGICNPGMRMAYSFLQDAYSTMCPRYYVAVRLMKRLRVCLIAIFYSLATLTVMGTNVAVIKQSWS